MAKTNTKRRNTLPAAEFGLTSLRKYPMPARANTASSKLVKRGK